MPQHTRLVTCHQNAKAIHYKWKFINSKEIGRQEPSGTHSSHRDQVPMISPVGEHGFNDQKQVKSKRGRNLIRNLKIDDNTTLNTDEEILSETKRFYQALYTSNNSSFQNVSGEDLFSTREPLHNKRRRKKTL